MKETLLTIGLESQTLKITKLSDIAEKSQNYLQAEVSAEGVWTQADTKIVCRFRYGDKSWEMPVEQGLCDVPWEVLREGYVYVSAVGYQPQDTVITTNEAAFYVGKTGEDSLSQPTNPSRSVYVRLTEDMEQIKTTLADEIANVIEDNSQKIQSLGESVSQIKTELITEVKAEIEEEKDRANEADQAIRLAVSALRQSVSEDLEALREDIDQILSQRLAKIEADNEYILQCIRDGSTVCVAYAGINAPVTEGDGEAVTAAD